MCGVGWSACWRNRRAPVRNPSASLAGAAPAAIMAGMMRFRFRTRCAIGALTLAVAWIGCDRPPPQAPADTRVVPAPDAPPAATSAAPQPATTAEMPPDSTAPSGPPAPADPSPADILVAEARTALTHGELESAFRKFDAALAADPRHERALIEYVDALLRIGETGRALVLAEGIAERNPDSAVAQRVHGMTEEKMGRMADAETAFRRALELNANDAETHYGLGVTLFRQRKFDDAGRHYERATQLDGRRAPYWNNWGCALLEAGQYPDAATKLRRALEINPQDAVAWSNLGSALERSGDRHDAIDCFVRATTLEPAYARAHQRLVQVLMDLGLYVEAVDRLQHAATVIPGPERVGMANQMALIRAACPDNSLRDPALAVRIGEGLIRDTEQRSFEAYDTLGIALAATGEFERAIAAADTALELCGQFNVPESMVAPIRARRAGYVEGRAYFLPELAPAERPPGVSTAPAQGP